MDSILGGSGGLGALEELLGGGKASGVKTSSKTKGKTKGKTGGKTGGTAAGGGVMAMLLPLLLQMFASKASGGSGGSGLDQIIGSFTSGGLGDIIGSWVGGGPNKSITPAQVKAGLGAANMAQLSKQSGLKPDEVAKHLSVALPVLVNHLTPDGKVPNAAALDQNAQTLQALLGQR